MWRSIMRTLVLFGLTLLPGSAMSGEKPLREQLMGTWKILSVNNTRPDGVSSKYSAQIRKASRSLTRTATPRSY